VNHVNATLAISGEKQTNTSSGGGVEARDSGVVTSKTFEERRRRSVMLCHLMKGQREELCGAPAASIG
jgi:hypothetical protein